MVRKQKPTLAHHVRRHTKLALVPHAGNQYRPHAVRRVGIIVALILVLILQFGYNFAATGAVLGERASMVSPQLLAEVNAQRRTEGKPPLRQSPKLAEAARLKAKDMLAKDYWAHNAPNGSPPWRWLTAVDYGYSAAGENLARGFKTESAVVDAWMASPSHRANVLDAAYTEAGFGVVSGEFQGRAEVLVVAVFAAPVGLGGEPVQFSQAVQTGAGNPLTMVGLALRSVSPAVLGGAALLLLLAVVALAAHVYRQRLPKRLRQSWYRHHGAYKALGLAGLGVVFLLLSASAGQV